MKGWLRRFLDRCCQPATALALIAGASVALAVNWPGQLSYDSIVQLHDGRTGHYNAWHPPVMAWMLGVADSILPGAAPFVVFDIVLVTVALLSLLRLQSRLSWMAFALALLIVALPQFVLYQGIVWKDVLFADASISGFILL